MGRQVRRVPLDFNWPMNKTWPGFLNPHWHPCPAEAKGLCHGGWTNAGKWLNAVARFISLIGGQASVSPEAAEAERKRGIIYPHPYLQRWAMAPSSRGQLLPMDAELHALVQGLAGDCKVDDFANSCTEWVIAKAMMRAAGVDEKTWGICPVCKGSAVDPAHKEAYEAWKPTEPPTGEGWQLWETVSEGSPVSKVFATRDAFVQYLRDEGYSEQAAQRFTDEGWAPSIVVTGDGRAMDGIAAAGER